MITPETVTSACAWLEAMESPSLPTGLDGTPDSCSVGTVNPDRATDDMEGAEPVDTGWGSTTGPVPAQPTSTAPTHPAATSTPPHPRKHLRGSLIPSRTVSPAGTVAVNPAFTVHTMARPIVCPPLMMGAGTDSDAAVVGQQ